jgi:hypothetical protein
MNIEKSLLTPEEIAGICGKFSRPENRKEGLHLLAEMAAQAQLTKITESLLLAGIEVE